MRPLIFTLLATFAASQADAQVLSRNRGYGYQPYYQQPVQQYYYAPYQPAYRPQPQRFDPNRKIDGASAYNIERMPELPTGEKLEVWVVLSPNWQNIPLERSIAEAVTRDPRMQQIKAGTKFNYYQTTNPLFSQSPLVGRVGTATPIFVVTGPGGEIAADGSAGLFMNAMSCPKTAAECVDVICEAIEHYNPPPKFEGQTKETPLVREITFPDLGSVEQCGPDGCPPAVAPQPAPIEGQLTPIMPRRPFVPGMWVSAAVCAIGCAIVIAFGVLAPLKPRTV